MTRPRERILVVIGLAIIVGLVALTGYLGYRRIADADAEAAAGATRVAASAPTRATAASPSPIDPTVATPTVGSAPTLTSTPAVAVTARPASTTAAAPTAMATAIRAATPRPTEASRYLGRDPLPPSVDLTNGPYLKEMKTRGARGANVGDGGLGDELKAAYLAALKVEEQALNTGDDSNLSGYFIGDALERLLRLTARFKADKGTRMSTTKYEPRVMEFVPETTISGVFEVVDARTETISTVERLPDGKPGNMIKEGRPERTCYSVQMVKEGGGWKVQSADAENDGPEGGRCPPYWS